MVWLSLPVVFAFAAIHVFAGRMRFIRMVPRSRWLSAAGGVSVAYVFVHLLPEAKRYDEALGEVRGGAVFGIDEPIYLLALLGLTTFYGLERWVIARRGGRQEVGRGEDHSQEETPPGVFWLHVSSFAFYNALICYLLVREAEYRLGEMLLYGLAIGLHFVVNDFGLHAHHKGLYHRYGRWLLAGAAIAGWVTGALLPVHPAIAAALFGFLCGAIVLNVLKEELPAERESRFGAFVIGAAGFTVLLLLLPGESKSSNEGSPETRPSPASEVA